MHIVYSFLALSCAGVAATFVCLRQKEAAAGAFVAAGLFWINADLAKHS